MVKILKRVAEILNIRQSHEQPAREEVVELPDRALVFFRLDAIDLAVVAKVIEREAGARGAAVQLEVRGDVGLARIPRAVTHTGRKLARPLIQFPVAGR